ncbi:hypothetical protein MTO96_028835 [Rhipicephalus appendiculatus]
MELRLSGKEAARAMETSQAGVPHLLAAPPCARATAMQHGLFFFVPSSQKVNDPYRHDLARPAALSPSVEGTSCRRCRSEPPCMRRRAREHGCALVHKGESFTRAARAAEEAR